MEPINEQVKEQIARQIYWQIEEQIAGQINNLLYWQITGQITGQIRWQIGEWFWWPVKESVKNGTN